MYHLASLVFPALFCIITNRIILRHRSAKKTQTSGSILGLQKTEGVQNVEKEKKLVYLCPGLREGGTLSAISGL